MSKIYSNYGDKIEGISIQVAKNTVLYEVDSTIDDDSGKLIFTFNAMKKDSDSKGFCAEVIKSITNNCAKICQSSNILVGDKIEGHDLTFYSFYIPSKHNNGIIDKHSCATISVQKITDFKPCNMSNFINN